MKWLPRASAVCALLLLACGTVRSQVSTSPLPLDPATPYRGRMSDPVTYQVDFSAVEYREPERLRYQFRLEGAEQEWSEPASNASVSYANLAPGRYRFLVRAINSEGLASLQPAAFNFTILPPLWRRWWIQALAGLALASAAYLWRGSDCQ